MRNPLIATYFIIAIIAYAIVKVGRIGFYNLPFYIDNYLTDFLCMPIVLTIALVVLRFIKKIPNYCLNGRMIFGLTTFFAFYFEYYLPNSSKIYTADPLDILMYFLGAVAYWIIWKRYPMKKQIQ